MPEPAPLPHIPYPNWVQGDAAGNGPGSFVGREQVEAVADRIARALAGNPNWDDVINNPITTALWGGSSHEERRELLRSLHLVSSNQFEGLLRERGIDGERLERAMTELRANLGSQVHDLTQARVLEEVGNAMDRLRGASDGRAEDLDPLVDQIRNRRDGDATLRGFEALGVDRDITDEIRRLRDQAETQGWNRSGIEAELRNQLQLAARETIPEIDHLRASQGASSDHLRDVYNTCPATFERELEGLGMSEQHVREVMGEQPARGSQPHSLVDDSIRGDIERAETSRERGEAAIEVAKFVVEASGVGNVVSDVAQAGIDYGLANYQADQLEASAFAGTADARAAAEARDGATRGLVSSAAEIALGEAGVPAPVVDVAEGIIEGEDLIGGTAKRPDADR